MTEAQSVEEHNIRTIVIRIIHLEAGVSRERMISRYEEYNAHISYIPIHDE